MTILTPESRALLKRMDADDAIDKAVELALNAAAKVCHNVAFDQRRHRLTQEGAFMCKEMVLALKEQK